MTDRKNILKKISSYLTKKSHINYLKHIYEYEINMIKEETK